MITWKFILLLIVGYAVIFFFISLWETKNLKDAFFEWIKTMIDWRRAAIPGLIFIIALAFLAYIVGH